MLNEITILLNIKLFPFVHANFGIESFSGNKLPKTFQPESFWNNIPSILTYGENIIHIAFQLTVMEQPPPLLKKNGQDSFETVLTVNSHFCFLTRCIGYVFFASPITIISVFWHLYRNGFQW